MLQKSLLFMLLAFFACKNGQNATSQTVKIETIVEEKIGGNYERTDQGPLALCIAPDKANGTNMSTVLVLDTTSGTIIYGPARLNARVSWYADRKLLIKETPEVVEDKMSQTIYQYIYDLDTKEKKPTTSNPY